MHDTPTPTYILHTQIKWGYYMEGHLTAFCVCLLAESFCFCFCFCLLASRRYDVILVNLLAKFESASKKTQSVKYLNSKVFDKIKKLANK